MYSSVMLYTSGVDSYIILQYVRNCIDSTVKPIYFNIKCKYSSVEIGYVKKEKECIIDNSLFLGDIEQPDAYIPGRNILLVTLAASKYSNNVIIGNTKSDRISDNNPGVFKKLSDLLTKSNNNGIVNIFSPAYDQYKEDLLNWYDTQFPDKKMNLLNETFSCYSPLERECMYDEISDNFDKNCYQKTMGYTSRHCFKCPACFRRNVVLHGVGISLPFFNKDILKKYKIEFQSKKGLDDSDKRLIGTLKYIDYIEDCGFIW